MGAKSLELQIRISRDFREPNAWPQHWENVLQCRHSHGVYLQESTCWSITVRKGHLGKKKNETLQVNLYSRCMEQVPDYAKKFVVRGVNSYSWNYPLVQEWLVLCVGALRIRSCLSFCLYLGRIQGKSSHPGKGFVWEIRAVKGPKLRRRCSLDALQKKEDMASAPNGYT